MKKIDADDLACRCCGKVEASPRLLEMLNAVQAAYGRPLIINSGYRCAFHNKEVGGVPRSAHTKGEAVDISCVSSKERFRMIEILLKAGFRRLGAGKAIVHADVSTELPQDVLWLY